MFAEGLFILFQKTENIRLRGAPYFHLNFLLYVHRIVQGQPFNKLGYTYIYRYYCQRNVRNTYQTMQKKHRKNQTTNSPDKLDTLNSLDSLSRVDKLGRLDRLDRFDRLDRLDRLDRIG